MEFVNLGKILKENTSDVFSLKSLFQREEEYADYLSAIECTIADYFLKNSNLKDKEVIKILKNIKGNYTQNLDFFHNELEKEIMMQLSLTLQEESITHYEFKLVLNYVLWCIDNRSWIPDNQAYVKWLPYLFDLYGKSEMKKYEENFRKISGRLGIPKNKVDEMLFKSNDVGLDKEEMEKSRLESEDFALDKEGAMKENEAIKEERDMIILFGTLMKIIKVGLEKDMKPKEVVDYSMEVFREFTKEIEKLGLSEESQN